MDRFDFLLTEQKLFAMTESLCVGSFDYQKETEVILQVIKQNLNDMIDYSFDINSIRGCHIPISDEINVYVRYVLSQSNSYAEYVVDEEGNTKYLSRYDEIKDKLTFSKIYINIFVELNKDVNFEDLEVSELESPDFIKKYCHIVNFDEGLYRILILHELHHMRDDYEIQKHTDSSLRDMHINGIVDSEKVNEMLSSNNPYVFLVYRLFIDTEYNVLPTQLFGELISKYMDNPKSIKRESGNANEVIKTLDTYLQYKDLVDSFYNLVYNKPNSIMFLMKYFRKWPDLYHNATTQEEKNKIKHQFKKWFDFYAQKRLASLQNRLFRAVSLFYSTYDRPKNYTYDDIVSVAQSVEKKIIENLNTFELKTKPRPKLDLIYKVQCKYDNVENKIVIAKYNPIFNNPLKYEDYII